MSRLLFLIAVLVAGYGPVTGSAGMIRGDAIEKEVLHQLKTNKDQSPSHQRTCPCPDQYVVYLIDNFQQPVKLIPELTTTHGELMKRILMSGRDDIRVKTLNTSLSRGLAIVIDALWKGACIDAVISSIPGSNYTCRQISSLLPGTDPIDAKTIRFQREPLRRILEKIAYSGFPSVEWLEQTEVNTSKLINDARLIAFAEALGRAGVPILIPYGNRDTDYRNEPRMINILSLASNVRAFSGADQMGRHLTGFPYSALTYSHEQAVYPILEIPDSRNPMIAHLDVNGDGVRDYTFRRQGSIAFRNDEGLLEFAPPVVSDERFTRMKPTLEDKLKDLPLPGIVLTLEQYRKLKPSPPLPASADNEADYVWLNPPAEKQPRYFKAAPWVRGLLRGTSLIPPNKVKELLCTAGSS